MKQFTNTYRITISDEMKEMLDILKTKYRIKPTSFIRSAIKDKLNTDIPKLKARKERIKLPF